MSGGCITCLVQCACVFIVVYVLVWFERYGVYFIVLVGLGGGGHACLLVCVLVLVGGGVVWCVGEVVCCSFVFCVAEMMFCVVFW